MNIKTRIATGLGAAALAVGVAGGIGAAGTANAAPPPPVGLHQASWWSPGCLTWHTSDGSCVGGQEGKNFQKGTTCAGGLLGGGPLTVYTSANDPDYRAKCFNLNNA